MRQGRRVSLRSLRRIFASFAVEKLEIRISSLDNWAGALGASMLSLLEIIK